jgi:hypothetical protein
MKATLQMLSLFLAIVSVLIALKTCFDGSPAKKPTGYAGLLISFVLYGLMFFLSGLTVKSLGRCGHERTGNQLHLPDLRALVVS